MRTKLMLTTIAAVLAVGLIVPAVAGQIVRGRDLMTAEEWQAHRVEMLQAQTIAERQAIRDKMRVLIEARAGEKGVTLIHSLGGGRAGGPFGPGRGVGPCPRGGWGNSPVNGPALP